MKSLFIDQSMTYDGTQLRSLFAYLDYKLMGDSIVSWIGPCKISFEHMVDGEDLLEEAQICGSNMVHFIIEKFSIDLYGGVGLQRLMASLCIELLREKSSRKNLTTGLFREGDDVYVGKKKFSISIATQSPTSTLVHFAVNIANEGTPVETVSLNDFELEPANFARDLMEKFVEEERGIVEATQKVKWVK